MGKLSREAGGLGEFGDEANENELPEPPEDQPELEPEPEDGAEPDPDEDDEPA